MVKLVKWKTNPDETNCIIFGSKLHDEKLKSFLPVNMLGNSLHPPKAVKNLGVWFDSDLFFLGVFRVCKACFVQLRNLRRLGQHLTLEAAVKAANALVASQLGYCNSFFGSLSGFNVIKLQSLQNSLARIATNTTRYSYITSVLKSLHCLFTNGQCSKQQQ